MNTCIRSLILLATSALLAASMCLAQDGAEIFKTKCAVCHGATGKPSAGMVKMMGMKPVSEPSMQAVTQAEVEATVKNGKGKMKPLKGLSDEQVKAVAAYFKTLK